jgi:hypothetical protein
VGLFSKLNRIAADARRAEEALYAMAAEEVANGDVKPGLWAKAFADSDGQESRAQATYLKLRVQQMKDELAALDRALHKFSKEWGDADSPSNTTESLAPETTARESPVENPHRASTVTDSPLSATPPVSDQALESLATSRSSPLAWLVAGSVLLLVGTAVVLNSGSWSTASRASSTSNQAPDDVTTEVRRLIQEGHPQEAYGLAHRSSSQQLRDEAWAAIQQSASTQSAAPTPVPARVVFSSAEPHVLVPDDIRALATIAGTLSIEPAESQHQLMLDGQRLDLPESYLTFLSMTRHPDQDIVLVSMNCGGTACTFLDLAFVRLYSNRPPVLETLPEFQFPSDIVERVQQGISLRDNTIDVALGLKDGVYWFASISPRDKLSMFAVSAPIEPLSDDDCKLAAEMLDYCTELKTPCAEAPFREFPSNCPDATMPLYRTTSYLANHTTGLNLPAFAQACKAASELSMAPSPAFIQSEICSGADPIQWVSEDAPTTSIEHTASAQ